MPLCSPLWLKRVYKMVTSSWEMMPIQRTPNRALLKSSLLLRPRLRLRRLAFGPLLSLLSMSRLRFLRTYLALPSLTTPWSRGLLLVTAFNWEWSWTRTPIFSPMPLLPVSRLLDPPLPTPLLSPLAKLPRISQRQDFFSVVWQHDSLLPLQTAFLWLRSSIPLVTLPFSFYRLVWLRLLTGKVNSLVLLPCLLCVLLRRRLRTLTCTSGRTWLPPPARLAARPMRLSSPVLSLPILLFFAIIPIKKKPCNWPRCVPLERMTSLVLFTPPLLRNLLESDLLARRWRLRLMPSAPLLPNLKSVPWSLLLCREKISLRFWLPVATLPLFVIVRMIMTVLLTGMSSWRRRTTLLLTTRVCTLRRLLFPTEPLTPPSLLPRPRASSLPWRDRALFPVLLNTSPLVAVSAFILRETTWSWPWSFLVFVSLDPGALWKRGAWLCLEASLPKRCPVFRCWHGQDWWIYR